MLDVDPSLQSPPRRGREERERTTPLHTTYMKLLLAKVAVGLVPLAGIVLAYRGC